MQEDFQKQQEQQAIGVSAPVLMLAVFLSAVVAGGFVYFSLGTQNTMEVEEERRDADTTAENAKEVDINKVSVYDDTISFLQECEDNLSCFRTIEGTNNTPLGIGTLTGFHRSIERDYEGFYGGGPFQCDVLVSVDKETVLHKHFVEMIERHNTVNSFDDDGNLQINVDLEYLSEEARNVILNSSPDSPVTLIVLRRSPEGTEAGPCGNFVEILGIR